MSPFFHSKLPANRLLEKFYANFSLLTTQTNQQNIKSEHFFFSGGILVTLVKCFIKHIINVFLSHNSLNFCYI